MTRREANDEVIVKFWILYKIPEASHSRLLRTKMCMKHPRPPTYWVHNNIAIATGFALAAMKAEQNYTLMKIVGKVFRQNTEFYMIICTQSPEL